MHPPHLCCLSPSIDRYDANEPHTRFESVKAVDKWLFSVENLKDLWINVLPHRSFIPPGEPVKSP